MSDTVKLVIEISNPPKNDHERWVLAHGIPLDDVKAEIDYERNRYLNLVGDSGYCNGLNKALKIIDNIGKAESEGKG